MERDCKILPGAWSIYPWAMKYIGDGSMLPNARATAFVLDQNASFRPDLLLQHGIIGPDPFKVDEILCHDEESTWMRVTDRVFKVHFVQLLAVPNMTKFQAILPKVLRVGKSSNAPLHIPTDTYVATNRAFLKYPIEMEPLWMHLLKNNRVEKFLSASTMEERTLAACIMLIELLNTAHAIHSCDLTHGFIRPTSVFVKDGKFLFSTFSRTSVIKGTAGATSKQHRDMLDCVDLVRFTFTGHFTQPSRTITSMLSKGLIDILQKAQTPMELPEFLNLVQSFLDSNFKGHAKDVSFLKFIETVIARAPVESPLQSEFLLRATSYDAFLFSLRKTALSVHKVGFVRGSIFMPENPSVCEDVMRHVFDHCDARTIQRTALANRSFFQTSWSLVSDYEPTKQLSSYTSPYAVPGLQRVAEAHPSLDTISFGLDDDPNQPLHPQSVKQLRKATVFLRDNRYYSFFASLDLSSLRRLSLLIVRGIDTSILKTVIEKFSVKPSPTFQKVLCIELALPDSEMIPSFAQYLPLIKPRAQSLDKVHLNFSERYYRQEDWGGILPAELGVTPNEQIVEKLKETLLDFTGLELSKLRVRGYSLAFWYAHCYKLVLQPAVMDAICNASYPSNTRESTAERAKLYWHIIKDAQWRPWSWSTAAPRTTPLLDWAYLRLDQLDPFEEVDGSPCYREAVTSVILSHAELRLSHLHTELDCSRQDLLRHTLALYSKGKSEKPENPIHKIEGYPKLMEALKIWSEPQTIPQFLDHIAEDFKKPTLKLSDTEIEEWSGYILDAYEFFHTAFEKALHVLEAAPEALSVVLESLSVIGVEFVYMIFALPYERRKLVLDPNLTHRSKRLWHYLEHKPELLDQVFSDPAFDPYRASSDGNLVNHLLREGRLTKPEILRVVEQLLDTDDAAGWDGLSFPNRPENICVLVQNPSILLNLARCAADCHKICTSATMIRTLKENPDIIPMLREFVEMHYQLKIGGATPAGLLREIGERVYAKGWRSIKVRKLVAEELGYIHQKGLKSSKGSDRSQLMQSQDDEAAPEQEKPEQDGKISEPTTVPKETQSSLGSSETSGTAQAAEAPHELLETPVQPNIESTVDVSEELLKVGDEEKASQAS